MPSDRFRALVEVALVGARRNFERFGRVAPVAILLDVDGEASVVKLTGASNADYLASVRSHVASKHPVVVALVVEAWTVGLRHAAVLDHVRQHGVKAAPGAFEAVMICVEAASGRKGAWSAEIARPEGRPAVLGKFERVEFMEQVSFF